NRVPHFHCLAKPTNQTIAFLIQAPPLGSGGLIQMFKFTAPSALLALTVPCLFAGGPVQWSTSSGGNGHWYQLVTLNLSWSDARVQAAAMGGYLATLTSATENNWVEQNVLAGAGVGDNVWIGGADFTLSGEWRWVEGPEAGTLFWKT